MDEKTVVSSFAYKFIERIAIKGIGLVISIILARLLDPDTFGLLAIITVFTNLALDFVTSGMGTALVQNRTTQDEDYSTVFFLSFGIAIVAVLILFFCAPVVGWFYNNDAIIWPLRALAFSLLFGALNSVQHARLQRAMQFRVMMICNLIATLISGAMGITAALFGLGLWALVIYSLASSALVSVILFVVDRWRPRLVFSPARAKEFWGFGWKMLVSALICRLYTDVRSLIIGRKYSAADLAYYNRGQQFPDIIAHTLDVSIQSVMLPVMSAAQDSAAKLNDLLLKTIKLSMFVVMPVMLGLAAVAKTLIPVLLTEKWNESVPLLVVFCFSYLTLPVVASNHSLLKATGRSDVYMKAESVRRTVMITVLLISVICFDSVMVIAVGFLINSYIDMVITIAFTKKLTGIGLLQQMQAIWKTVLLSALMAAGVAMMNVLPMTDILKLTVQVITGVAIYVGGSALLKLEAYEFVISFLKQYIVRKK